MSRADVLAINKTKATFVQIQHVPCRFRTALCPDRCGHAKDTAIFTIDEYIEYQQPGKYGDEKAETFYASLVKNDPDGSQSDEIIAKIRSLKPGQKVRLDWDHIYVHDDSGAHPERPIKVLEDL